MENSMRSIRQRRMRLRLAARFPGTSGTGSRGPEAPGQGRPGFGPGPGFGARIVPAVSRPGSVSTAAGPGPFPPFPGPGPFPPGPGPFPRFVTVFINGGRQFPWMTRTTTSPSIRADGAPGARQYGRSAVRPRRTNRVGRRRFTGPGSNIRTIVRLNGRVLPPGFLNTPVQPGSFISLELSRFF